ncbi:pheromone p-factor receptor [Schizosaccharomyces japonicus yFS275]|uniref:Pheromone p-factor receptor n=1 Tax=Schizosaccharomyces japonicus (strain yFS275 / FY16936) TaxID=402676 RepID=B6JZE2_SCHJY|nr:pheromone p-factor receptor [Schizosaccharomyces japonicus yFS275]EEB06910.1 pheromone p-factor receptor [Schizosaccharomyces japonicus yFS275]
MYSWDEFRSPKQAEVLNQTVTLETIVSTIQLPISEIDSMERNRLLTGMTVAVQVGLGSFILVLMCIFSSSEKRKKPVFIFNFAGNLVMTLRAIFEVIVLASNNYSIAVQYGFAFAAVRQYVHAFNIIILLLGPFILFIAEMSLMLQVRIICSQHRPTMITTTVISCIFTVVTLAFWITDMSQEIAYQLFLKNYNMKQIVGYSWLYFIAKITFAASIIFHSSVFSFKLMRAIYIRRKIGQFPFGPMQCIFIVSCQCLIVPAIFTLIDSFTHTYDGFSSMTQCLLIISLPLSSLWATHTAQKLQTMKDNTNPPSGTQLTIRVDRTFDMKFVSDSSDGSFTEKTEETLP